MLILQRLRVIPLPNVLWPSSFPAPFQEISSDRLSKNGADLNREEVHFSGYWDLTKIIKEKKICLRLGVSDLRNQNQSIFGSKIMKSTLRKSWLTNHLNRLRSAVPVFACANPAPVRSGFRLKVETLRPCSRLNGALARPKKGRLYFGKRKNSISNPWKFKSRFKIGGLSALVRIP